MAPVHHDQSHSAHHHNQHPHSSSRKIHADPIRNPPPNSAHHSKLAGCGKHRSYRHLNHQRGVIGTFRVRLLEGRGLSRHHWSALSLGPVKHLGLSRAHGEVSSFGTCRLAFWADGGNNADDYSNYDEGESANCNAMRDLSFKENLNTATKFNSEDDARSTSFASTAAASSTAEPSQNSIASVTNDNAHSSVKILQQTLESTSMESKIPAMVPVTPRYTNNDVADAGKSPMTPLFNQGCIRSFSPARSPFNQNYAQHQQKQQNQYQNGKQKSQEKYPGNNELGKESFSSTSQITPSRRALSSESTTSFPTPAAIASNQASIGPIPPHHYAKEDFRSSVVHCDSNPIWGDAHSFLENNYSHDDSSHHSSNNQHKSTFHIPLKKDDLFPTLHTDGGHVALEIRLDEDMTATESLLVGGALSSAVSAATVATSVMASTIPRVGHHVGQKAQVSAEVGMEMLGLGKDRLIGRGFVDLMPLLLGLWDEDWEKEKSRIHDGRTNDEDNKEGELEVDEYGRIDPMSRMKRRRVERMGMLDVWVPLYHASTSNSQQRKSAGKVHLLISYEPNGMVPQSNDAVAFESFARRPLNSHDGSTFINGGSVITPIVPPFSPLLVIDKRGAYLLLEYVTSRTVTSVDRSGIVKSSRWERTHRVRIHRNAVFVIERQTIFDAAGNLARMPVDIVKSTPIGREIAEVSAPLVAAASELMGPALLWGKLMMAAGGTGVKAGLAGAQVATEAVVRASQERALQSRESEYMDEQSEPPAGVYQYVG